jgi:hypothetical protein
MAKEELSHANNNMAKQEFHRRDLDEHKQLLATSWATNRQ